jgi:hypothetical protein
VQELTIKKSGQLILQKNKIYHSRENTNYKEVNRPCYKINAIHNISTAITSKGKCKAIPLQALTGPEGSRRLRLPDFKTICT